MLKIRYKNNKYNSVWLVEPKISVGHSATNDLVVDDPYVADKHFEVHVSHETLTLKNLQPLKPIRVNTVDVIGACTLKVDDEITLGAVELIVIDPKRESKVAAGEASNATQMRPVQASSGWALKANHAALANRVFPLKDSTTIGRSADCDISLAAAHLSRRHAQLSIVDGALYVKDLDSANGTFLNGKQVMEARVKRGDELRFDALSFGVMGPADELAKTTVRTMKSAPNTATAAATPKSMAPSDKFSVQHSFAKKSSAEQDKSKIGSQGVWLIGILALLAVAVLIIKH